MPINYRVVMVRHGESEWNEKNLFCGWYDAKLSSKGNINIIIIIQYTLFTLKLLRMPVHIKKLLRFKLFFFFKLSNIRKFETLSVCNYVWISLIHEFIKRLISIKCVSRLSKFI